MALLLSIISKTIIFFIKIYQFIISPLLRPCCRFFPSCSQYAIKAISEFGILYGVILILRRILKCHAFKIRDINSSLLRKSNSNNNKIS